jgi:signal transduction histidine kinase
MAQTLKKQPLVVAQESRLLKRKITAQLKKYDLDNARYIADLLIDIGACDNIEAILPLLRSQNGEWAVQFAYNLTSPFVNNQMILSAVDRSSKIVFALKNYARIDQTGKKETVKIIESLETTLAIYHNQLKNNIKIVQNYQKIPDILGYPDELIQVWTNLIHNAIQAMEFGGTLTLKTQSKNQGIEVCITDTGCGISPEAQQRIFDVFFTTKPVGEGSGLGLYICQKIVNKHRGTITVESHPGYTQFRVWLPIDSAELLR